MPTKPTEPIFFLGPDELQQWFALHSGEATELIVGFYKTSTGRASLTWPQAVDEALCVGWIDGVRHRIDDERYKIRFTPRKRGSHWSSVNIGRIPELTAQGRMTPAGLAAFEARTEERSRRASYEQGEIALSDADEKLFRKNKSAWAFFESTPASYRRKAIWRVISAKKPETRTKRLHELISSCAEGKRAWD